MFENPVNPFHNKHVLEDCATDKKTFLRQYDAALSRFKSVQFKGIIFRVLAKILRRRAFLYDLNEIKPRLNLQGSHYCGVKVVQLDAIIGTEGKASDFDTGFHPRNEASRERWVNVAMEYLCCFALPPVQLTQIGDAYFVRDGHHRISVARAFGQMSIDAEVVTWNALPPFPWQPLAIVEPARMQQQANLSA